MHIVLLHKLYSPMSSHIHSEDLTLDFVGNMMYSSLARNTSQRIQYKILLLTFKVLHMLSPRYLSELRELQVTELNTRQTDTNRLHKPVMKPGHLVTEQHQPYETAYQ